MKTIAFMWLSLLLFSCAGINRETEINQLKQRITLLEQRIDSLISSRNGHDMNGGTFSYYTGSGLCQAITKKGNHCRRKARNNNHCWQHGG